MTHRRCLEFEIDLIHPLGRRVFLLITKLVAVTNSAASFALIFPISMLVMPCVSELTRFRLWPALKLLTSGRSLRSCLGFLSSTLASIISATRVPWWTVSALAP